MKSMAVVVFFLVSPAVFWDDHEYMSGALKLSAMILGCEQQETYKYQGTRKPRIRVSKIVNPLFRVVTYQVVSDQQWSSVTRCMRDRQQHDNSHDRGHAKHCKYWPFLLPPRCQPRSSHCRDYLYSSEWHIEQNGLEAIETEGVDDQRAKGCDATTWNTTCVRERQRSVVSVGTYEIENIRANQHQVLISNMLSLTCSHFQVVETTPIWFALSRSTARILSC